MSTFQLWKSLPASEGAETPDFPESIFSFPCNHRATGATKHPAASSFPKSIDILARSSPKDILNPGCFLERQRSE